MNIDTLLDEADPGRTLTLREQAELDRMVDSVGRSRRRLRTRGIVGVVALSALVLAGGATAAAAGIWHPSWYDPESDWTTEVKTVDRAFTVDGKQHHCTVQFTLESTYNGKGTAEFRQALRYLRSLDLTKIKPTKAQIDDLLNSTWVGQGPEPEPPSRAYANQQVWLMDVSTRVFDHLNGLGLDGEKVRLSEVTQDCDVTR